MDDTHMTEMSLDEQQDIHGGDWWEPVFLLMEGTAVAFGML